MSSGTEHAGGLCAKHGYTRVKPKSHQGSSTCEQRQGRHRKQQIPLHVPPAPAPVVCSCCSNQNHQTRSSSSSGSTACLLQLLGCAMAVVDQQPRTAQQSRTGQQQQPKRRSTCSSSSGVQWLKVDQPRQPGSSSSSSGSTACLLQLLGSAVAECGPEARPHHAQPRGLGQLSLVVVCVHLQVVEHGASRKARLGGRGARQPGSDTRHRGSRASCHACLQAPRACHPCVHAVAALTSTASPPASIAETNTEWCGWCSRQICDSDQRRLSSHHSASQPSKCGGSRIGCMAGNTTTCCAPLVHVQTEGSPLPAACKGITLRLHT